nr:hypothetical protein [Tanacetum cinerariifolium]
RSWSLFAGASNEGTFPVLVGFAGTGHGHSAPASMHLELLPEIGGDSGSDGCGNDEPGYDEDGDEDEEDADSWEMLAEEITLCKAWCDVTKNYVTRDANMRRFWSKVVGYFEKEMEENIRGYDVVIIQWKCTIRPKIAAFSVVYDNVQRMNENESCKLTVFQRALAEYEMQYRHDFTLEACWRILKDHVVWTEIEMPLFNPKHNNEV